MVRAQQTGGCTHCSRWTDLKGHAPAHTPYQRKRVTHQQLWVALQIAGTTRWWRARHSIAPQHDAGMCGGVERQTFSKYSTLKVPGAAAGPHLGFMHSPASGQVAQAPHQQCVERQQQRARHHGKHPRCPADATWRR